MLQAAVKTRHQGIVRLILAAGVDVNTDLEHPGHVLFVACGLGDDTSVQLLLAAGANVNVSGKKKPFHATFQKEDVSPLHMASERGYESVVTTLLAHGADIEKEVETSEPLLPYAFGPDSKKTVTSGTPLLLAAIAGHVDVVRSLVATGANVNYNADDTALSVTSTYGHFEVVQELLKSGASITTPINALHRACTYRRHQIIALLLEGMRGTVEEQSACTQALFAACTSKDDTTFRLLLECGALQSPSIFREASIAGLEDSVRMMLENGVDVNNDDDAGGHALHAAACYLQSTVVRLLLDHGATVQMQDTKYGSPIMAALEGCAAPALRRWACNTTNMPAKSLVEALPLLAPPTTIFNPRSNECEPGDANYTQCEQAVQALVDRGASIATETRSSGNALHLAAFIGSEMIVQLLLDGGADINSNGGFFETVFLAALQGEQQGIVELLLSKGSNVNTPVSEYGTALHCACSHGPKSNVQLLLNSGADLNARGGKYGTPLAAAESRNSRDKEKLTTIEILQHAEGGIKIREDNLITAAAELNLDEE